jgi:hypothetical protein
VSCGTRRTCSAGGSYTDGVGETHPFIVDEISGTWRRATVVKGSTRPAFKYYTVIQSISCGQSNGCTAFGDSLGPAGKGLYYFVLTKREGAWSSLRLVPGSASSAFQGFSGSVMACSTDQSCTVAGSYYTSDPTDSPLYALTENIGYFTRLVNMRGVARLHLAPTAGDVVALSCGASDNCVIAEFFSSYDYFHSFFVHESTR